jgi:DNA-binding MarR family transcriptional regulator
MCPTDRRGIFACLTEAGRARYDAARPTHRSVLAETL